MTGPGNRWSGPVVDVAWLQEALAREATARPAGHADAVARGDDTVSRRRSSSSTAGGSAARVEDVAQPEIDGVLHGTADVAEELSEVVPVDGA